MEFLCKSSLLGESKGKSRGEIRKAGRPWLRQCRLLHGISWDGGAHPLERQLPPATPTPAQSTNDLRIQLKFEQLDYSVPLDDGGQLQVLKGVTGEVFIKNTVV